MVIKMEINDGYMPFKGFKTYYRIVDGGDKTPLICLHGGPGSTHNYFEVGKKSDYVRSTWLW